MPLDALGYVQFDDAPPPIGDDLILELQTRRVMPGAGRLDLPGFCQRVKAKGFDGVVSIEVLSDELRTLDVGEFARVAIEATRALWGL
jgi:sugar phosphate isomerase/epimerase